MRQIVDPRFRASLPNQWPSLCTIQQKLTTLSDANQPIQSGVLNILTGLVDIPCLLSLRKANEKRDHEVESKYRRGVCRLNGYFINEVISRSMLAVVDGVVWQIRGVDFDSLNLYTLLELEQLNTNPGAF